MKLKKKNKIFVVILVVLLIVILVATAVSVKFWNTISAVFDGLNHTAEEIENVRIENQKKVDEELSKYPDLYFRNLTQEEIKALSEGKISRDDVPYLVTGRKVYVDGTVMTNEEYEKYLEDKEKQNDTSVEPKEDEKVNSDKKQPEQKPIAETRPEPDPEVPKTDPQLEAVLEKLFVLKATFLADIENQVNSLINEYLSIPKKYRSKKVRNEYISKAFSLMAETEPRYDAEFEAVVKELETVLKDTDGDMGLVDTVRTTYKKEKAAIKAKYVSKAREYM